MYIAILIVHLTVSLILIGVILLQAGRGGGLADFGGSSPGTLGTRASTYLTKATTVCAVVFICTSIGLAVLSARQGRSLMQQMRAEKTATPPAAAETSNAAPPAAPAPAAAAPPSAPEPEPSAATP